jgi:hypothetical protein
MKNTLALAALLCTVLSAQAQSLTVAGTANIWGAGRSGAAAIPAPAGGSGGTVAPSVSVAGATVVQFDSITGLVNFGGGRGLVGPDGFSVSSASSHPAYNSLSGITLAAGAPLLGVFLSDSVPAGVAPATLSFAGNTAFASLSPQLQQVFFIGDGLTGTGTGTVQQFMVPTGATRLFLGLADGFVAGGLPGGYENNTGSFAINVSAVPEPASALLLAAGMALVGWQRRRQALR